MPKNKHWRRQARHKSATTDPKPKPIEPRALVADLAADIVAMRLTGYEIPEIAKKFCMTQKEARELLAQGLADAIPAVAEYTKEYTSLLMLRSERAIRALWARVESGEAEAIKSWDIIERNRQRMLGIVTKTEVDVALKEIPMKLYKTVSPDDWEKNDGT